MDTSYQFSKTVAVASLPGLVTSLVKGFWLDLPEINSFCGVGIKSNQKAIGYYINRFNNSAPVNSGWLVV